MPRYRLRGNYGTFEVEKEVEAADEDAAFEQTGIAADLRAAGWTVGPIDGEIWSIDEVQP